MADETLRFDIVGEDRLSGPLARAGASAGELSRHMDAAARSSAILDEALKRQQSAARTSVDATLALARADKILEDAERGLTRGALEAELALKKQAEAEKKAAAEALAAAAARKKAADGLAGLADKMKAGGGPAWLGPALAGLPAIATLAGVAAGAAAGLAGAFAAGGAALAAFGAVARPVLDGAQKAAQAVEKAQNNYSIAIANGVKPAAAYKAEQIAIGKAYAELSPQQIALSRQLQAMGNAWQAVKAAQTPVVAGALQPWLQAVTGLTKQLGSVIAAVSPVINGLGVSVNALVSSQAFRTFTGFIAGTGSAVIRAAGNTGIDLITAFITLLPKFTPLISAAAQGIANFGTRVLDWANSKKAADDITRFMAWFSTNGPVVAGLLTNIGKALAALAPGLTAGGTAELKAVSDFFGWIARLPRGLARPLAEAAGALLVLNKLGVFSVGVKFVGLAAGWIRKLLGGAAVDIGAAGMQTAGDTMLAASAAMQRAAATMAAAAGTEVTAGTEMASAGGLFAGASPAMSLLGAGLIAATAFEAGKSASDVLKYVKSPAAAAAASPGGTVPGAFTTLIPPGVANRAAAQNAAAAASPQGQGVISLLAQGKAAQALAVDLKSLNDIFAGQVKAAQAATAQLNTYTASVKASGTQSAASRTAAAILAADLTSVGVRSSRARADVAAYTTAITANGIGSSQAQAARRQIVTDILAASGNARQGKTDLDNYTASVAKNGTTAQVTRQYRAQLIADLEKSGVDSQTAATLVNGLGTAVKKLPASTALSILMSGKGTYSLSEVNAATGKQQQAAGGLFIRAGSGPRADDVLIRASRGELVVPAHMVAAGEVDHLRGRIPGFRAGGVTGNLTPAFITGMYDDFKATFTAAMVAAMRTAIRAATAAAAAAAAAGGGGHAGPGGGAPAANAALARKLYPKWASGAEWAAWNNVAMAESGWNQYATNPGSGAYGIPQALPYTKMPRAAWPASAGGSSNPTAQITWMAGYMASRYGGPAGAWAHEQAQHWYGDGLDAVFRRPTVIGVGERGPEHVRVQPLGPGSGGDDRLIAELRALRAELRELTGVAAAIPARTGQHVAAGVNGVGADAAFRRRYPGR